MLLAAAVSLFLAPALLTSRVFAPADLLFELQPWHAHPPAGWTGASNSLLSDSVLQFEPWLGYAARQLHNGQVPLWNPDNMLGAPFIGNMQSALFYPANWLYLLWPQGAVLALLAWLKLLVAALGMYLLARQVGGVGPVAAGVAALTFTFSAFVTVWLLYPLTNAVVWLPWLWWSTARLIYAPRPREIVGLALVVALTLLAGQPEMAYQMTLATGLFALFFALHLGRRTLRRLGLALTSWLAAYLLGALLSAVQLVPFLDYLGQSAAWLSRAQPGPADFWLPFYLSWTAVSPDLFGNPVQHSWWDLWTNYNEANIYCGVLPLLLAPLAFLIRRSEQQRFAWFLLILTGLALGVAYNTPLLHAAFTNLPLAATMANQRLVVVAEFTLALLAALGIEAIDQRRGQGRRALGVALSLSTAAWLAWGVGVPLLFAHSFFHLPEQSGPATDVWLAGLGRTLVWVALVSAALLAVLVVPARQPHLVQGARWLLPLLLLADLWLAHSAYNPTVAPDAYFPPTAATNFLRTQAGLFRTVAAGWTFAPNTNLVYDLADLRGYDALEPQLYRAIAVTLDPTIPQGVGGGFKPFQTPQSPLLNLLNVRYLLVNPGEDPNYRFDTRQEAPAVATVGEIQGKRQPGQTFIAEQDTLVQIQVFGATYARQPTGHLTFHLKHAPSDPLDLATVTLDTARLADDSYWLISFAPIRRARGQSFYFYFESLDAPKGAAVTLWYSKGNPYRQGTRMDGARPVSGDLVFRTVAQLNADQPWFERVLDGGAQGTSIWVNRRVLPRAWLVHQVAVEPEPRQQLRQLSDPTFSPAETALLAAPLPENAIPPPAAAGQRTDTVTITSYQPESVEVQTQSPDAGLLILSDQAFSGWEAQVDRHLVPILTVDYTLRGVYLPAGKHTIRFVYTGWTFLVGLSVSALALITIGWLTWLDRRSAMRRVHPSRRA